MARFIIVLLLSLLQIITPAYAGTQSIVKADILEGLDVIKNYAGSKGHFEKNVNGWTGYDDGAAAPVDCSGGTFGGTIARTTSSPLSGDGSLLWTKGTTASVQGEGIAMDFTIDSKHKGSVLKAVFSYIPSSVFSNDQVGVYVYDVTNGGAPIQLSPYKIPHSLVETDIQPLEFQAAINSTSYRLCLHVIGTDAANNWTLKLDDLKLSKSVNGSGIFVSDWQSYTPTFEGSTTAPTIGTGGSAGITGRWRRVGDTMHVEAHARFGTTGTSAGSGTLYLAIPSEYTIDSAKLSSNMNNFNYGHCTVYDSASAANHRVGTVQLGSGAYKWVGCYMNATGNYSSGFAGFSPNANDDEFSIQAIVPIVNWSSNMALSSNGSTAINGIELQKTTNQSATAATTEKIAFESAVTSKNITFDDVNDRAQVLVGGTYLIIGEIGFSNTTAEQEEWVQLRINGAAGIAESINTKSSNASNGYSTRSVTALRELKAGDYVELWGRTTTAGRVYVNTTSYRGTRLLMHRLGGNEQIAASETVAAVYTKSDATAVAGGSVRIFGTKVTDTHNAYSTSTGYFTAPIVGLYQVCASYQTQSVTVTSGQNYRLNFFINGATVWGQELIFQANGTYTNHLTACADRYLLAGQTIGVVTDGSAAVNFSTSAERNWVSFKRIGL